MILTPSFEGILMSRLYSIHDWREVDIDNRRRCVVSIPFLPIFFVWVEFFCGHKLFLARFATEVSFSVILFPCFFIFYSQYYKEVDSIFENFVKIFSKNSLVLQPWCISPKPNLCTI